MAKRWNTWGSWAQFKVVLRSELKHLITVNASERLWQMPAAAALSSGLPLLVGAYFGRMDYGLVSMLGGLVFLYLPTTPMSHRMVSLMACAFGMIGSYAFGAMSHFFAPLLVVMLTLITIAVNMLCRFYRVGPPGSLFFVMAAMIGAYSHPDMLHLPLQVGLIAMGCLSACVVALFYSLYILRLQPPAPVKPLPPATFEYVVFDSVVIGAFVGGSLAVAHALEMPRAYWVPISCLAVIQGMSLRAVWNKQLHRIAGTGVGLLLAWALLMLPLNNWTLALMMVALTFIIEIIVVRHYGFAVIFITPLTIFLAEAATLGRALPSELIEARFFDTLLGCLAGLAGGICLHSPRFREAVGSRMRRLVPIRRE